MKSCPPPLRTPDLSAADVPRIDLYMDQILTLVDEGLAGNKRSAGG